MIQTLAQWTLALGIGVTALVAVSQHRVRVPSVSFNAVPRVALLAVEAGLIWLACGGWPA